MDHTLTSREGTTVELAWNEVSGAVGDAATVLPIVVAVAALTEFSLAVVLLWFGVFQVVWGLYYGTPVSVEPMKALAALAIAGTVSTGEVVVAGLLLAAVLLVVGATRTLDAIDAYVGAAVVRGIQFGVALVLLEAGVGLARADPAMAGLAAVVATVTVLLDRPQASAFVVFLVGSGVAVFRGGTISPALPAVDSLFLLPTAELTGAALEATVAQLAMTVGNAALATAILLELYFDRDISADQLSTSMGVMNAVAVPFGGLPMCHGSGGVAGKYAFGARTAGANIVLGVGYVLIALLAVGLVSVFPTAALGIILVLIAGQLGYTSLDEADEYLIVVTVGVLGVLVNLGVALVVGVVLYQIRS